MAAENNHGEIIVYQSADGQTHIDVRFENETVWLSIDQMAELFDRDKSTVSRHIKNIFAEGELSREVVVAKFATTTQHGAIAGKTQTHMIDCYNLDVIISVGYRVKSLRGTQFRQWATTRLKEYMLKGFALDDERLKGNAGGNYWKELLARIRDIRSSEKMLYRQVLDLYATSVDYDPCSPDSIRFFQIVQNKLHYAAHGHTAAEVIFERADAEKPFMGLQTFPGEMPVLKDVSVAKNYLSEDELRILNNLVSGYFDIAEINAIEHKPMKMSDYIRQLDAVLSSGGRQLLSDAGDVSHQRAIEKATYDQIEGSYDSSIFTAEKHGKSLEEAFPATKAIQDYVYTDGTAEKSIERKFVEELDGSAEVNIYAKLPKGFSIPTPVGHYSPDWAIVFHEGKVKHIYFVAETKGTMDSLNLRPIEKAKIDCAKKLFATLSNGSVTFDHVDSYQQLMNKVMN